MIFSKLVEVLKNDYFIEVISDKREINICDVALIDVKRNRFLENTLYFGYDSQLQGTLSVPSQCILTHSVNSPKITYCNCNLAYTDDSSLFSIFNEVKSYLEKDINSTLYEDLITISDKTQNLNSVIDLASINLGQSLLLCDTTFKIIASSSSIPVSDPVWSENVKKGYCNYDFIQAVKSLPSIKNRSKSSSPVEVTCSESPNRKFTKKVFLNKQQVGFILMIEGEKKISSSHDELLNIVCDAVEYTVKKYISNLSEIVTPHYRIMYDCIIGVPLEDIERRLSSIHFPPKMAALYIEDKDQADNWYKRNQVVHNIKLEFPGTHVTYDNNGIIAAIPYHNVNIDKDLILHLNKFAENENIKIGISYPFSSIKQLYNHYQQSSKALTLGKLFKPTEIVYPYEDYLAYDLISRTDDKNSLNNLLHPSLSVITDYDKKNKTQLFNTLKSYINNDCTIKTTASELFIHRNTLSYRLNKIIELSHLDFEDHHTKFLLKLSFLINDYSDKIADSSAHEI